MITDFKRLWDNALADIELVVSRANFRTWFRHTQIIKYDRGTIFLGVPNTFVKEWLFNKFHRSIIKSLRELVPEIRGVEYLIVKSDERNKEPKENVFYKPPINNDLGLNELYINREDNLNPKYLFENFVVGPFNEVAHAAIQSIANQPGTNYNPLFIYGGTGLGKTHLIQAVGNHLKTNHHKRVHYTTSERFSVEYVSAVQNNRINMFKSKYRKYDVFIMDDVQFLSNKEKTQEELFHLFNTLHENNHQIIFSSDKTPKYIPQIEDRLRSRFEGGMVVGVEKPDLESRLAILRAKAKNIDFPPDDEVIAYLAEIIKDNIRELEGALNSIACQSFYKKRPLSLPEVKILIKNNLRPVKNVSVKNVAQAVASFYNIEEKMLYEKTRKKEVVKPRQIVMFILREDFNISYPYIGQKMGGRDHTTVIYACDKVKEDAKNDSGLQQEIEQIRNMIYNQSQ